MPYTQRMIRWRASKTSRPADRPKPPGLGSRLGFHIYQFSLYLAKFIPSLLPKIERFVHILHYGAQGDGVVTTGVADGHTGLLMDCLYSQFVNEWAISLEKGPEAISRLSKWLNEEADSGIPFSSKGLYVHAPIEVRVSDTSNYGPRPYLDFTYPDGPTLFLNATLYRPYHRDPPGWQRYYEGFEWLMKDLGGRPHWAKNFRNVTNPDLHEMYPNLDEFLRVRRELDPKGLFVGDWHRRLLLIEETLPIEECKIKTEGEGGDLLWYGNTRRKVGYGFSNKRSESSDDDSEKIRLIDDED